MGSTSLTTNSGGGVVAQAKYYPYGADRAGGSGTTPTDYRFTGQRSETSIGLYDYGARFYDPLLGRFISADAIVPGAGNPQALNRYAYVGNNPLKYTDPSGHIEEGDEAKEADDILYMLLQQYGITILKDWWLIAAPDKSFVWLKGNWKIEELRLFRDSMRTMADRLGGTQVFRRNVGPFKVEKKEGSEGGPVDGPCWGHPACAWNGVVSIWNNTFASDDWFAKSVLVHEVAHIWDQVSWKNPEGGPLSKGMMEFVGNSESCGLGPITWPCVYNSSHSPPIPSRFTDYAQKSRREDWAVSVSAWVLGDPLSVDRSQYIQYVVRRWEVE